MGDASHNKLSLASEEYRLSTFGDNNFVVDKDLLAKAGFYHTWKGDDVKCFDCSLEIDIKTFKSPSDIARIHKEKRPDCQFAKGLTVPPKPGRSKTFISYDSLRFEKERLETFIDWPIKWLRPTDLAGDGFYYLRTADHCACVFCRGIVGAWEMGDTPRGEHQRHFPHCPFIRGQPVGNVPINQSNILARIPSPKSSPQSPTNGFKPGSDICGPSRHMAGSYPECRGNQNKVEDLSIDDIGLPQYTGPKRKDFLTTEMRLKSFVRWPERVTQKPNDLAEAGFFYCGLSDHVRCFHCGNGLRNWEKDDVPWNEHARWYPECNYVLLKKGQDFIDKVRREKPPYIRTAPAATASTSTASSSSNTSSNARTVADQDLDPLMDLDIIRGVLGMGFPTHIVRSALRDHVQQTGLPYFNMESCIESVLAKMEEETRQTIQSANNYDAEDEATESQSTKIQAIHSRTESAPSSVAQQTSTSVAVPSTSSGNSSEETTSTSQEAMSEATENRGVISPQTHQEAVEDMEVDETRRDAQQESGSAEITNPSSSVAQQTSASVAVPSTSSESSSEDTTGILPTLPNPTVTSTITTLPSPTTTTSVSTANLPTLPRQDGEVTSNLPVAQEMEVNEPQSVQQGSGCILQPVEQVIMQADETMSMAEEALKPPSSGPPSLGQSDVKVVEGESSGVLSEASGSGEDHENSKVESPQTTKELAAELERIRDSRMCKVCMDAEMDVVFLPCTHMVSCATCAVALAQCPICRKDIKYSFKPIVS